MDAVIRSLYTFSPQKVYRHFAQKKRQAHTRRIIKRYLKKYAHRKLQIGCGGNILHGWLNSDLVPDNSQIALIDASKPFPIQSSTFDLVYSEHLFEHLDIYGQLNYLRECLRILKPGGKIRIATPDFDFLIDLAKPELSDIQKKHLQFNSDIFLKQIPEELRNSHLPVYVINNYVRDWGHQMIHNVSSLRSLLEYAGFNNIQFVKVGLSKEPDFENIERHWKIIGKDLNELETMIIEAVALQ